MIRIYMHKRRMTLIEDEIELGVRPRGTQPVQGPRRSRPTQPRQRTGQPDDRTAGSDLFHRPLQSAYTAVIRWQRRKGLNVEVNRVGFGGAVPCPHPQFWFF
jgi:hypothetical protein